MCVHQVLFLNVLSAHPTAPFSKHDAGIRFFLPAQSPTSQTVRTLDEEAQLVARRGAIDEIS